MDLQGKPDKSSDHLEEILCSVPHVVGCFRGTSDMSIFLQLVDVLVGCVHFDVRDQMGLYDATSTRGNAKRSLVRFVKGKIGLRLEEPFLPADLAFRRWSRMMEFSVWIRKPLLPQEKEGGAAMSGAHPA